MIEVKQISSKETHDLRHRVLWPHIALAEECVIDIDHRKDAIHLGAIKHGKVVGICSLFELSKPALGKYEKQYRLRVMATDASVRGLGAGAKLIDYAIALLRERGYDVLWCDARKVAIGFYERLGFEVVGDCYEIPNIGPHKLMCYSLKSETR